MSTKLTLMVVVLLGTAMAVAPAPHVPENVFDWYADLPNAKPKYTQLHLYIHDILNGDNPSVALIARANATARSSTGFGSLSAVDDPLTLGPETDSETVGHVEGMFLSASRESVSLLSAVNFVFNAGDYNGSTISVLSRITAAETEREFAVVSGTGYFRLAEGVVSARSLGVDPQGNPIVECRVLLRHY